MNTRGFNYIMMTDLDGVCGGADPLRSYDHVVFERAFARSAEWDAASFVFEPYWDLWAFRHPIVHPFDQFGPKSHANSIQTMDAMTSWIKTQELEQFIEVDSAFMMLAIYKTSALGTCRYSGRDTTPARGLLAQLGLRSARSRPVTCEHVPFHRCLRHDQRARLRIWPEVYCVGDNGWVNHSHD